MVTDKYFDNQEKTECVTLELAKQHLKLDVDNTDEDELIQNYIDAATVDRENFINRSINTRDFIMEVSQFETTVFSVNYDNDEVTEVKYYSPGGTDLLALDADKYKVRPGTIVGTKSIKFGDSPITEKRNDAVIITVKQGWVADEVPVPIKQSILLLVSDMYERREDRGEIGYNRSADSLCRPYRKY
ncbi:head-tail connector protein [Flavobacterium sp. SLB02]|uniref:head-tail connector protein n=1 Tax=Flavobacterium sp. SLB02 TaxID=2665645 RepID=UPI0012AAAC7E|nr:head-tail connector protein [Flavobacterium sp. SLB02]QGK72842.1 hypothetical protein GIY83_01775 [Flavobacterium sp. SLB02]